MLRHSGPARVCPSGMEMSPFSMTLAQVVAWCEFSSSETDGRMAAYIRYWLPPSCLPVAVTKALELEASYIAVVEY